MEKRTSLLYLQNNSGPYLPTEFEKASNEQTISGYAQRVVKILLTVDYGLEKLNKSLP